MDLHSKLTDSLPVLPAWIYIYGGVLLLLAIAVPFLLRAYRRRQRNQEIENSIRLTRYYRALYDSYFAQLGVYEQLTKLFTDEIISRSLAGFVGDELAKRQLRIRLLKRDVQDHYVTLKRVLATTDLEEFQAKMNRPLIYSPDRIALTSDGSQIAGTLEAVHSLLAVEKEKLPAFH